MIERILIYLFPKYRMKVLIHQLSPASLEIKEGNKIGFWPDPNWFKSDPYPLAQSLVVQDWNKTKEGRACISYMKAGRAVRSERGYASCRLCGARLGTSDMVGPDGKWLYPEKWEHYIEEHSVRPDSDKFIKEVKRWFRRH